MFVLAAAAGGATLSAATPADACTPFPPGPPELVGYPADGATDVPTDVLPIYDTAKANVTVPITKATFVLRWGDTRAPLPATNHYASVFTLMPLARLEPNTAYVIEATLPSRIPNETVVDTVTFTTGAGPAAPAEKPQDVFLQNFFLVGAIDSCDPIPGTCVAIPAGQRLHATRTNIFGQGDTSPELWDSSRFSILTQGSIGGAPAGCVSFRTRAANGLLSEPVVRCVAGAPTLAVNAEANLACTSNGITENGRVVSPARGCSISAGPAPSNAAWLISALALLGAWRVKRRDKR
ncbi:MAG TPA: Ig-like domain-containing protein [Polyangiaceae bacterium]